MRLKVLDYVHFPRFIRQEEICSVPNGSVVLPHGQRDCLACLIICLLLGNALNYRRRVGGKIGTDAVKNTIGYVIPTGFESYFLEGINC
eukprot:scaffold19442_cov49-Attheya_sp.AAC.1